MGNSKIKNTLILFNEYIYKEIDLESYRKEKIVISNTDDSDLKVNIRSDEFYIIIKKVLNYWEISNGDGINVIINGIKTKRKKLIHGDQIKINNYNNQELFKINFFLDFSTGKENYDKGIDIKNLSEIKIGRSEDNEIVIKDNLVDEYHCVIKEQDNRRIIVDLNSKYNVYVNGKKVFERQFIKDNDFIIICGYKFLYNEEKMFFSNENKKIKILSTNINIINTKSSLVAYPAFIRTPRLIYKLPEEKIDIISPPKKEQKQGIETFLNLIPMIGMTVLMMGMYSGRVIYRVGMLGITVFSTVFMFVFQNRKVKKNTIKRNKMYTDYLNNIEEVVKKLYDDQKYALTKNYPTINEAFNTIQLFERRLWEKDFEDDDFLEIFIGKGKVDLCFELNIPKEEFGDREDEMIMLPREMREKYKEINDMPITLNIKKNKAIGIIGESKHTSRFIRNIILEIVTYHYYEDVNIACICNEENKNEWLWMRWLPHVWSKDRKVRFIGVGKDSGHAILECLNDVLNFRVENSIKKGFEGKPHFVLIITDPNQLQNEQISKHLESANELGITVIYAYDYLEVLPKQCTEIINIICENSGEIIDVRNSKNTRKFNYSTFKREFYEDVAKRLGPIYVKKSYSENTLPKCITLFELYDVKNARQLPIIENWENGDVCKTMAVPLGIDVSGEVVELNLHEKFHGPHGLVAGTTGSGKSEILQSYIISLAIKFHPYDVSFILIDYKGGGMANLFKDLPHLIGTITNLDGNLVNRSLDLIKSELKRRQRIFSKHNVNHIDGYKNLEKENKELEPLPHLIIIADEFAELKSDQPEFMKELVSTARIGRSLGVHLILATQKPSGVVDSQIWSNSKFKLCLKVQDASDSNELLKKPDAAYLVDPGRAYFQVGNNEIYQLFQSAWSGAKKYEDDDISNDDIKISEVSIEGIRKVIYSSKEENSGKKLITQLDETIRHINKIFNYNGFKKIDDCWVPPLEEVIQLEDLIKEEEYYYNKSANLDIKIDPIVGVVDCPSLQKKLEMRFDLSNDGNILLVGSSGYGKTTFIQTLLMSLILNYSPKDVNIYALDFGTRTLKIFEGFPHIGGVAVSDDEEKIANLFKMIKKQIIKRKALFAEFGASSLKNYRIASNNIIPQIVIIIDNFIAFKELYENYMDDIALLSREGTVLGISLVISNNSTNGISYKIIGNFKNKFAFTCIDSNDYLPMIGTSRKKPTNLKGRALIDYQGINEMQVAIVGKCDNEVERIEKIKEVKRLIIKNNKDKCANLIPMVPEVVDINDLIKDIDKDNKINIPIGFDSDNLEYVYLDANDYPNFIIMGETKSGKTNMLKNIIFTINKMKYNSEIFLLDSKMGSLNNLRNYNEVKKYANEKEDYTEIIRYLIGEGLRRKSYVQEQIRNSNEEESTIINKLSTIFILIDSIEDIIKEVDRKELDLFENVVREYKAYKIITVACGSENEFKSNTYTAKFVKALKESQCGIVLDSINNQSFFNAKLKYGIKEKEITKGDGYLILNNKFLRIKTPKFN